MRRAAEQPPDPLGDAFRRAACAIGIEPGLGEAPNGIDGKPESDDE